MTTAKPENLGGKLRSLFGSLRFWTVTASAVAFGVAHPHDIAQTVSAWLAAVAAIGSADSVAEKLSSKKPAP